MTDMYTRITIDHPGRTGERIQEAFEKRLDLFDPMWEYIGDSGAEVHSHSKYEVDGLHAWAKRYVRKHDQATVVVYEEWTGDDGPSVTERTYQGGKPATGSVSAQVPENLFELIDAVNTAAEQYAESLRSAAGDALESAALGLARALDTRRKGGGQ